jgi:TolB-like protein/Tfp pilus assembly protein PilF/class 3 adenylate cyclase
VAEQLTGKLAVILHADVVGSTALVQRDERRAHERITNTFQRLSQTSRAYGGEVHEIRGDALVADFARASDAVCAAIAFQQDNTAHNKTFDDGIIPEIRVGISLGEVVIADNTVTGAGVVLAQRVEQLAEPGGVCITEAIREAIPERLPLDHHNLGAQALKGFEQLAHVHSVRLRTGSEVPPPEPRHVDKRQRKVMVATAMAAAALVLVTITVAWLKPWQPDTEPASMDRMAHSLPDKPSIAVLPFENLSGDPEQDYLAGGMTEEVITTLSRVPNLFVIADSSTDIYKGKAVAAKQVAEEHGVRYVLQGSMQRAGDRVRINVQLVDALEGNHVWAERYDREFQDLFALQDDITRNIALAIQGELTEGDLVWRRAEGLDPEALHLMYKARRLTDKIDRENVAMGRKVLMDAQSISPNALFPLAMLGWLDAYEARYGWSPSRESSLQEAEAKAREVLARDETYPEALMLLGYIHVMRDRPDEAIRYYQIAVDANPNHARAVGGLGWNLAYAGRPTEAISSLKKAMRLSPYHPGWMDGTLGLAYMMTGEYDKAIQGYKDSLAKDELVLFSHERLAAIYALKGDLENARLHAATVLEIKPDFSIEGWSKVLKYKRKEDLDRELNALRTAGLPEKPPLALPDKPSIAVLPFTNLTGDSEQDYFVDGFTNEIITNLSKFPEFFVIASNSVFTYKGKAVRINEVGRELGVRYVLEGSLQRSSNNISVHAQLIEAASEKHLWAEQYEGTPEEIFSVQKDLTRQITSTLASKVENLAHAAVLKKDDTNLPAYELFLKAGKYEFGKEAFEESIRLLERAIELDPNFTEAYAWLANRYLQLWRQRLADDPDEALRRARDAIHKAFTLDQQDYRVRMILANLYQWADKDHDLALAEYEKALALNPNQADVMGMISLFMAFAGRGEEAVEWIEKAKRLNPHYPVWYDWNGSFGYYMAREYDEALLGAKRTLTVYPESLSVLRILAATYVEMGNMEKATEVAKKMLEIDPQFKLSNVLNVPLKHQADRERYFGALAKAGLPE